MIPGAGIIPVVSSGPWVITVAEDDDGDYVVQATTQDPEETGTGIDAIEHRFLLALVEEGNELDLDEEAEVVAVYWGVQVHTCESRPEDSEETCEIFKPSKGEVEEDDVPEEVVAPVGDLFSDEVYVPTPEDMVEREDGEGRELRGVSLVSEASDEQIASLGGGEPNTDPGGMFQ